MGIHKSTHRRCVFLDADGCQHPAPFGLLREITRISRGKLHDILLGFTPSKGKVSTGSRDAFPLVDSLLQRCMVVHALVKKAEQTHYLNHPERLTLLYTIGQLGDEGKKFLHTVIGHCLNYDYAYTQKQIKKMKPYPISCPKIKEKHQDLEVVADCHCQFNLPKDGYPSPILHAFGSASRLVRTKGRDIESVVQSATDESRDLNEILKKYLELKRHLRGIEKSLKGVEDEMNRLFESAGKDKLNTEYGELVRRFKDGRIEWIIEI